jgi:hypothetical protein
MRLSDVKGARTLDVVAEIVGPISEIIADEKVMAMFEGGREQVVERMGKSIPVLIRDHKRAILVTLSAIKGVTPERYEEDMTLASLVGDVYELMTDTTFLDFLGSSGGATAPSGS